MNCRLTCMLRLRCLLLRSRQFRSCCLADFSSISIRFRHTCIGFRISRTCGKSTLHSTWASIRGKTENGSTAHCTGSTTLAVQYQICNGEVAGSILTRSDRCTGLIIRPGPASRLRNLMSRLGPARFADFTPNSWICITFRGLQRQWRS